MLGEPLVVDPENVGAITLVKALDPKIRLRDEVLLGDRLQEGADFKFIGQYSWRKATMACYSLTLSSVFFGEHACAVAIVDAPAGSIISRSSERFTRAGIVKVINFPQFKPLHVLCQVGTTAIMSAGDHTGTAYLRFIVKA